MAHLGSTAGASAGREGMALESFARPSGWRFELCVAKEKVTKKPVTLAQSAGFV